MSGDKHPESLTLVKGAIGEQEYSLEVDSRPTVEGQLSFNLQVPVEDLSERDFVGIFYAVKRLTSCINESTRYAVGTDGGKVVHLFPLQDRSKPWKAITWSQLSFSDRYPGYLTTKSGPPAEKSILYAMQGRINRVTGWSTPSFAYPDAMDSNLFARLVRGEIPQWRVWEDDMHIAFLTPFPNTPGFTVLIPRRHLSSDILSLEDNDFIHLAQAAHHVSRLLKKALDVKRVGMFFEGYEIDYSHIKLIPVPNELEQDCNDVFGTFHSQYPGFITTQPGAERDVRKPKVGNLEGLESCATSIEEDYKNLVG